MIMLIKLEAYMVVNSEWLWGTQELWGNAS